MAASLRSLPIATTLHGKHLGSVLEHSLLLSLYGKSAQVDNVMLDGDNPAIAVTSKAVWPIWRHNGVSADRRR